MIIVAIVVSVVAAIALAIWSRDKKGLFVNTTRTALGMKPSGEKKSWFRRLRFSNKTSEPPVVPDSAPAAPAAPPPTETAPAPAPNPAVVNAMNEQFAEVLQDRRETINNLAKEVEDKHDAVVKLERYRHTCQSVKDAYTDMREAHDIAVDHLKRSLNAVRAFVRDRPEWDHTVSLDAGAIKDLKLALDKYASTDTELANFVSTFKRAVLNSRPNCIRWINRTRVNMENLRKRLDGFLQKLEDRDVSASVEPVADTLHSITKTEIYALHRIYSASSNDTKDKLAKFGIKGNVEDPSEYARMVDELMRDVSSSVLRLETVDKEVAASFDNCAALMRENQIDVCVTSERPTTDDLRALLDCAIASISPSAPAAPDKDYQSHIDDIEETILKKREEVQRSGRELRTTLNDTTDTKANARVSSILETVMKDDYTDEALERFRKRKQYNSAVMKDLDTLMALPENSPAIEYNTVLRRIRDRIDAEHDGQAITKRNLLAELTNALEDVSSGSDSESSTVSTRGVTSKLSRTIAHFKNRMNRDRRHNLYHRVRFNEDQYAEAPDPAQMPAQTPAQVPGDPQSTQLRKKTQRTKVPSDSGSESDLDSWEEYNSDADIPSPLSAKNDQPALASTHHMTTRSQVRNKANPQKIPNESGEDSREYNDEASGDPSTKKREAPGDSASVYESVDANPNQHPLLIKPATQNEMKGGAYGRQLAIRYALHRALPLLAVKTLRYRYLRTRATDTAAEVSRRRVVDIVSTLLVAMVMVGIRETRLAEVLCFDTVCSILFVHAIREDSGYLVPWFFVYDVVLFVQQGS